MLPSKDLGGITQGFKELGEESKFVTFGRLNPLPNPGAGLFKSRDGSSIGTSTFILLSMSAI